MIWKLEILEIGDFGIGNFRDKRFWRFHILKIRGLEIGDFGDRDFSIVDFGN
jgi:hypothetical protein